MEKIEFRIREHKFSNGSILWFIPERSIERKPFPEGGYDWVNIGGGGNAFNCITYEYAVSKIKEFIIEKNNSYEINIIHNLPELTMTIH